MNKIKSMLFPVYRLIYGQKTKRLYYQHKKKSNGTWNPLHQNRKPKPE